MASGGRSRTPSRKVMVVVDMTYPNRESATALQYALSHVVLENDTLVLLFVGKKPFNAIMCKNQTSTSSDGTGSGEGEHPDDEDDDDDHDFIEHVKKVCHICKPRLEIVTQKMEIRDGEDKGSVILSESRRHGIELLIIGQKRSISNAILGPKCGGVGSFTGFDTAEFLIENCKCTCVAVQKKGKNAGYLLNTKTYRNFWLLA